MKPVLLTRRALLLALGHGTALSLLAGPVRVLADPEASSAATLAALEQSSGGRLGVCVLDAVTLQPLLAHRADERFGMCSTFKLLLAGAVLREAQARRLDLAQGMRFGPEVLVPHSPVVERHIQQGALSIRELAHAIVTVSDNAAANLLLQHFDGPEGFTRYLRAMGDEVTRLDRLEPQMNLVLPGEVHDTTTPRAMAETVARLFNGTLLVPEAQTMLQQWMIETRTGLRRLRAGFPPDWQAGDKTGTGIAPGMPNRHNDVAVVWRDGKPALVIAAYHEADGWYPRMREVDDAVLAGVGRIVAAAGSP